MSYQLSVNGSNIEVPNVQELVFSTPANQSIEIDFGETGFVYSMEYSKPIAVDVRSLAGKGSIVQRITTKPYDIKISGKYISSAKPSRNIILNGTVSDLEATKDLDKKLALFKNLFMELKNANYLLVRNTVLNNIGIRNVVPSGNPRVSLLKGEMAISFSFDFKGFDIQVNTSE